MSILKTADASDAYKTANSYPLREEGFDPFITGSFLVSKDYNDVDLVIKGGFVESGTDGWMLCGEPFYEEVDGWRAYRKGDVNLIVCEEEDAYRKWAISTSVMRKLFAAGVDLSQRDHRVALFQGVFDAV